MAIKPIPPPLRERVVDSAGMVTPAWADFFNAIYRLHFASKQSVADGTYTLGLGSTDGEITVTDGFITGVQEVVS